MIALRRGKYEPAYPSGHTTDATAVLATGAYLLVREGLLPARMAVPLASGLAGGPRGARARRVLPRARGCAAGTDGVAARVGAGGRHRSEPRGARMALGDGRA